MLGLTPDIDSERVKLEDFLREVKEVLSQTIEVKTKQVESKLVTHTLGKRNASALEKVLAVRPQLRCTGDEKRVRHCTRQ